MNQDPNHSVPIAHLASRVGQKVMVFCAGHPEPLCGHLLAVESAGVWVDFGNATPEELGSLERYGAHAPARFLPFSSIRELWAAPHPSIP